MGLGLSRDGCAGRQRSLQRLESCRRADRELDDALVFRAGRASGPHRDGRAGNVIGGGDWCKDRIIPDAARAFSKGETLLVRNPHATRPWQHVLDPLHGYLELARFLWAKDQAPFPAWNFGPDFFSVATVADVVGRFAEAWGSGQRWRVEAGGSPQPHEAGKLGVDSTRARRQLGWHPVWELDEAVRRSAMWYRDYCEDPSRAGMLVARDIDAFFDQKANNDASKGQAGPSIEFPENGRQEV